MKSAKKLFLKIQNTILNPKEKSVVSLINQGPSTKVSGVEASVMVKVSRHGPTVPATKDNGEITEPTVTVNSFILMVMSTSETGSTIKQMAKVLTLTLMEPNITELGKMTFSTDKEKRLGPMVAYTKASTNLERSTDVVSMAGATAASTMVTGVRTR